jgi:VanZ family protein
MKKEYLLIGGSLFISLLIYLFYRTEKTVVNEIFNSVTSPGLYPEIKRQVSIRFPLNEHVIYSLPEGLWVFCITLTSKHLFIKAGRQQFDCVFIPLLFSIGLEFCQFFANYKRKI